MVRRVASLSLRRPVGEGRAGEGRAAAGGRDAEGCEVIGSAMGLLWNVWL